MKLTLGLLLLTFLLALAITASGIALSLRPFAA